VTLILLAVIALTAGCGAPDKSGASPTATSAGNWFVEQAQATGIDFVHVNGMSGERKEEWPLTTSNRWVVVREGVGVR
jgi:hypothetical protein